MSGYDRSVPDKFQPAKSYIDDAFRSASIGQTYEHIDLTPEEVPARVAKANIENLAESIAAMLAVHLLREHSTLSAALLSRRSEWQRRHSASPRLRRVLDLIEANLDADLSLGALAAAAALSRAQFVRVFKRITGVTPHAYVLQRRVERAQELLLCTELAIAEIAFTLGFADQSHFTAVFRRSFSATPAQFRRSTRS